MDGSKSCPGTTRKYSPEEISHQEKPACVVIDGTEDGGEGIGRKTQVERERGGYEGKKGRGGDRIRRRTTRTKRTMKKDSGPRAYLFRPAPMLYGINYNAGDNDSLRSS